jgi:hypothetical protein
VAILEGRPVLAAGWQISDHENDLLVRRAGHWYHTLEEFAAAQLTLGSGIAVTGVSAIATGAAFMAIPETGGLSASLIPFTMTSAAGGVYLTLTGVNANIDAFNSVFGTNVPNLNSMLPRMNGQPPLATFPALSPRGH